MPKRLRFFVIVLIASAFFLASKSLLAVSFNPNNILSDAELQDYSSLGRGEISLFLRAKGSYLADFITQDIEGNLRLAGEIIYRAAQQYAINPKYILIKLQKEQSLVTEKKPSERQLDWATGYGVCDSCDTADPALQKHKGFGKQVDSAAGIMRWYYDNVNKEAWIKRPLTDYVIDATTVRPENYATAFLYTYTPHLQGNQNFLRLWNEWFTQSYPNGTLIKSVEQPTVYVVEDGKKRPIKSMSVLVSRYDPKLIVIAPAEHVASYPEGKPIDFPNYSILRAAETYYLLDGDALRPFATSDLIRKFGYHPDEIIVIGTGDVYGFVSGTPITSDNLYPTGRVIKLEVGNGIYFIKDGAYFSVPDINIAKTRFPNLKIEKGVIKDLEGLRSSGILSFQDGTLVGHKTTGQIFAIDRGNRRHITSEAVFLGLGYNWSNVIWIDETILALHQLGQPVYMQKSQTDSSNAALLASTTQALPNLPTQTQNKPTEKEPGNELSPTDKESNTDKQSNSEPVSLTEGKLLYFNAPANGPAAFPETGKMIATPTTSAVFFGFKNFSTPIDAYIIAKYKTGQTPEIVTGKNIDVPRPLASFTKVMTANNLLHEGLELNRISTFDPQKHTAPYHHFFKIAAGEQIRNRDLLYSMLVSSLNTPSRMLAQSVAENESDFISRMTTRAREWGLTKTYFKDTSGYDINNQGTAKEYLTIFAKALENGTIRHYLGTKQYKYTEVTDKNESPNHADDHSNKLALTADLPYTVTASKTGFLYESGYGIAMLVTRNSDGQQYIIITMGNPDYQSRFSETDRLTRLALTNY